ncbi:hypothetical protein N7523_005758 [Penicillium sp. IBT 18751x]|nr:hypothetical protein N7523_005758 [Penicillium sp. IBT 18751x]
MRFLLLFAVLATGAVDPVEKSVFAADSTTVTITKTVTVRIVTGTVPTANRAQAKYESTALLAAALDLTSTIPALADLTPAAATATTADAYQHDVLFHHNIHRRNHSAPSVNWSTDLETSARALAAKCVYEHDTSIDEWRLRPEYWLGVEASQIGVMLTNLLYNDEMEFFPTPTESPPLA